MRRSCLVHCCFLAFYLVPVMGSARAVENLAANLTGVVYSETTNARIAHATILLCDDGGSPEEESITNDSGEFAFLGLQPGSFMLKVNAAGYEPAEVHVEVSFGTERGISIFLEPTKTSPTNIPNGPPVSAHELSQPEAARKLMASGNKKLYGDKNAKEALQDFQAAVAKAPEYYEAYYQISMAYLALKNSAEAERNLEKAVDLSQENFAEADLALATLLITGHDTARGEALLRRGLELKPDSWTGLFELGKLELYRNQLEPALEAAEKAKSLEPEQALIYRLLSLIHLRQKNYAAAIADLDAYIRLDPDSPEGQTAKKIRSDTLQLLEKSQAASAAGSKPD